jgi:hypothetical protein
MSKRAGKIGSDVREALRAGAAWTPMIGVIIREEENGDNRSTASDSSRNRRPERRSIGRST